MKRFSEKTGSRVLVLCSLASLLAVLLTSSHRKGRDAKAASYEKGLAKLDAKR